MSRGRRGNTGRAAATWAPFSRRYFSDAQARVDAESLARQGWQVTATQRDQHGLVQTYGKAQPVVLPPPAPSEAQGTPQSHAQPAATRLYDQHSLAGRLFQRLGVARSILAGVGILIVGCIACAMLINLAGPAAGSPSATDTNGNQPGASATRAVATSQALALSLNATATADASIPTATDFPTATPLPTATATPKPTATTAPPPPAVTGVNGNPWDYTFSPGKLIYSPPADFCGYFNCIASFWNGSGYVEECQDGMYSLSGGHSGSCSYHGGNWRPLYAH